MKQPRIKIVKKFYDKEQRGDFDTKSKLIRILGKQTDKMFKRTLMHELVHYFLDKQFDGAIPVSWEEDICEALEPIGEYLRNWEINKK